MNSTDSTTHQKRPFNLTLSATTVAQARQFTGNLSATVDSLLAEYVAKEAARSLAKQQLYAQVAEAWNEFEDTYGAFADEHSTL